MKKILSILLVVLMAIGLSGCSTLLGNENSEQPEEVEKVYTVGDTIKVLGVSVTVTSVESGQYCDNRQSSNGSWVKVNFTMKNENDDPYLVFYSDFTLNDSYTIRNTSYSITNIQSGGFYIVKGNAYEFFTVFDCKYRHTEKDMIFMWDRGFLGGKQKWVV